MLPELEKNSCTRGLTTRIIGSVINFHDSVESTNDIASDLAAGGAKEGTVIMARTQTAGKGRNGRSFSSPRGGIYLSIILKPKIPFEMVNTLPLVMGLSVSKAIQCTTFMETGLKWPNDILIGDKKVAGILMTSSIKGRDLEYVVVGIGINLNTHSKDFSEEARSVAGSLKEITGNTTDPNEFSRDLLYFLDLNYSKFLEGQIEDLLDQWTARSETIGAEVKILGLNDEQISGKALGVDQNGCLILQTDTGMKRITTGDCIKLR
jgi:BirA family biotin operon repressor/biotin-[acetyl-CoA-carboxylase] ligase